MQAHGDPFPGNGVGRALAASTAAASIVSSLVKRKDFRRSAASFRAG